VWVVLAAGVKQEGGGEESSSGVSGVWLSSRARGNGGWGQTV
jgi:hypothetical protein